MPTWPSPASPSPILTERSDIVHHGMIVGRAYGSRLLAGKNDETFADAGLLHTLVGYHRKTRVPRPESRSRTTIEVTWGQLPLPSAAKSPDVNKRPAALPADAEEPDGARTTGRG